MSADDDFFNLDLLSDPVSNFNIPSPHDDHHFGDWTQHAISPTTWTTTTQPQSHMSVDIVTHPRSPAPMHSTKYISSPPSYQPLAVGGCVGATKTADDAWNNLSALEKQTCLRPVLSMTNTKVPILSPPTICTTAMPTATATATANSVGAAQAGVANTKKATATATTASTSPLAGSFTPTSNSGSSGSHSPSASMSFATDAKSKKKRDRVCDMPDDDLPPEQLNKRNRRRELNKLAAQRSRQRKQTKTETLEEEVVRLREDKVLMQLKMEELERENRQLKEFQAHQQQQQQHILQQQHHQQQQQQQQQQHILQQQQQHQQPQNQQDQKDASLAHMNPKQMLQHLLLFVRPTTTTTDNAASTEHVHNRPFAGTGVTHMPTRNPTVFALMSVVFVVVWFGSRASPTTVVPLSRNLKSIADFDELMSQMSWDQSMPSPSLNSSEVLLASPSPSASSSAFAIMTLPPKDPLHITPQSNPTTPTTAVIDEDAHDTLQHPLPRMRITHKFAQVEARQAAEYIQDHGQPGTHYIFCPEAHVIVVEDVSTEPKSTTTTTTTTTETTEATTPTLINPATVDSISNDLQAHPLQFRTIVLSPQSALDSAPLVGSGTAGSVSLAGSDLPGIQSVFVTTTPTITTATAAKTSSTTGGNNVHDVGRVVILMPAGVMPQTQNKSDDATLSHMECLTQLTPLHVAATDHSLSSHSGPFTV